jgi:hypothetical protein
MQSLNTPLARCLPLALVLALSARGSVAHANPRPLPFTYIYETLAEGDAELEQYGDLTPVRARDGASGAPIWYGATQFQTEFEYGITNRLELGLYVTFVPSEPSDHVSSAPEMWEGNGLKQRLRYRFADEGVLPLDLAVYGELVENQDELELEAKIVMQKRLGDLRVVANLSGEHEFYFNGENEWVLTPSLGLTYQVTPLFQPGLESFLRGEIPEHSPHPRPFGLGPHVYLGPTVMLNFGKVWWSTGAYVRVTKFDHVLVPEDSPAYGKFWLRSVIGVGL